MKKWQCKSWSSRKWRPRRRKSGTPSPGEALFLFRLYVSLLIFAVCGGLCVLPGNSAKSTRESLKAALVKNISLEEAQYFLVRQGDKIKAVFSQEPKADFSPNGEAPLSTPFDQDAGTGEVGPESGTGTGVGVEAGTESGAGVGTESGAGVGSESGAEAGIESGAEVGAGVGLESGAGAEQGIQSGTEEPSQRDGDGLS